MHIQTDADLCLPTIPLTQYQDWSHHDGARMPVSDIATVASIHNNVVVPEWQNITFTGKGREYFRIWIVNLCLSLATLGIYSAWAKVRRLQYFDRNTSLAGAGFNFHGDPRTILRGRIVAVILLFCYHYLFTFSKSLALTFFVVFLLGVPIMMRSALRFRLRQTSYRGLRFHFDGSPGGAYRAYLPVAFVVLLPGLAGVLNPKKPELVTLAFAAYLAWPWLHARMRIYQHGNIRFGQLHSACDMKGGALGWSYFAVVLALFCVGVLFFFAMGFGKVIMEKQAPGLWRSLKNAADWVFVLIAIAATLAGVLVALACVSYIQAAAWNKSWDATSFPGMDIDSSLPYWPYWRLQVRNFFFTVFSAGLYRPFAVVALYQFRLRHVRFRTLELDQVSAVQAGGEMQATGDSSADLFGFDLSW
ncbi:YjgN family protein [Undibacterium sp. TS12]|uniref:YjgN family protein n=1 Tax=Undibacterium sp. TS12 TaxID=2908202 RepID=UPI001F4C7D78|nr:YjgN family protein [Undibacterium sp. TS12]MCH8620317.1 DUF898 domain-containing protein [Undibacterium sp. TS12]